VAEVGPLRVVLFRSAVRREHGDERLRVDDRRRLSRLLSRRPQPLGVDITHVGPGRGRCCRGSRRGDSGRGAPAPQGV